MIFNVVVLIVSLLALILLAAFAVVGIAMLVGAEDFLTRKITVSAPVAYAQMIGLSALLVIVASQMEAFL